MNTLYVTKKGRKLVIEHIIEVQPNGVVMTNDRYIHLDKDDIANILRIFERK